MTERKRVFFAGRAAGLAAAAAACLLLLSACCARAPGNGRGPGAARTMPARPLGRTGHLVPLFSLGGTGALVDPEREEEALLIINRALDIGVNYIDTAPRYGDGLSETRIGKVMRERRDEVFLVTKSHEFSYEGTMRLVRESLARLQTDRIDLYLHHGIFNDRQLEQVLAEDGALRAFRELKAAGTVGHIGVASHSPRMLLKTLETGEYDCMLITLNPAGRSMTDRDRLEEFMGEARTRGVGVIAMKVAGRGTLPGQGATMEELFRYALSYPVATAIIGISEAWQVDDNARIAGNFAPLPEGEKRRLEALFE